MTDSPEEIRARIESTRAELGSDVDALADKVTPSKIVHRQTDRVRGAVGSVRDRVMGAAGDARDAVSSAAGSAGEGIGGVGGAAKAKAEGNPLAVGLIAFGVGLLAASLVPASTKEKEIAENLKEQAQPLVHEVADAAKGVAENLKEPAKEAVSSVQSSAAEAVDTVKGEAQDSVSTVRDEAQGAASEVRDTAQSGS
ncbi:DUF3618 domain-containing protein [Herbiconiux sp. VKM Ac-2851]|uniref:DUF3618 domain-containing protein n=1 Tax=Herbiconiux sp. VKM Ac-2851 TaxID=2739025 RepID=UPI001562EEF8|nr:DUF3618 domain-containing protein [Herbiconiux sp. VKM Ac-2851]NQX34110.1 DUF3618 domain-containing protein [Herbiconiux sp. VKM Ac-2851]